MSESNTSTMYHLYRRDGSSVLLHPFHTDEEILRIAGNQTISGFYGREPQVEAITALRSRLYQRVDAAVGRHVRERLFIPKFLAAAGVFLLSFFFLSLVILTPIPVLDELLISSAAAVAAYIGLGRLQNASERASQLRIRLRGAIDAVHFSHDPCVEIAERLLADIESLPDERLLQELPRLQQQIPEECRETELAGHIRARLPDVHRLESMLQALRNPSPGVQEVLHQKLLRQKVDIPLLMLALALEPVSAVAQGFE
ncbi:hypothetical protein [Spirochaeta africana]|uniref:Uncharacterized protein n=1 Tax=Spirochaeta africana (strain ATCC 700263 / DSM 8902 / Z-7692) TaxID=889378 RepID=H9UJQ4_SPIAZ|nr:hypothetical protein [Spirochaeta africana]AFG37747.1 hypothetical protein Spiaf_1690 [Spirochaeta africana DSM 8902]